MQCLIPYHWKKIIIEELKKWPGTFFDSINPGRHFNFGHLNLFRISIFMFHDFGFFLTQRGVAKFNKLYYH
jgi:hypothetical protein